MNEIIEVVVLDIYNFISMNKYNRIYFRNCDVKKWRNAMIPFNYKNICENDDGEYDTSSMILLKWFYPSSTMET